MEGFVLLTVLLVVYFLPTMVAYERQNPAREAILIANLVFGWTVLGWLIVLILAAASRPKSDLDASTR